MTLWSSISLKTALLRLVAMTFLLVLVLAGLGITLYEARTFQQRMEVRVQAQLKVVAVNLQAALDFDDRDSAIETMRSLALDPLFVAAAVYRADQSLFTRYTTPTGEQLELATPLEGRVGIVGRILWLDTPIAVGNLEHGHIQAFYQLPQLSDRLPQYLIVFGVLVVALAAMAVLQYLAVEKLIAKPARALAARARAMSPSETVNALSPENEIQQLQNDFERMLAMLSEREQRLKSEQERLQLALNAAQQGVWELDVQSGAMIWDSAIFEMTGLSPNHFSPSWPAFQALLRQADVDALETSRQALVAGLRPERTVIRWPHRDRGERFLEVVGRLYAATPGHPGIIRGVIRDVTESVSAEHALRASELQFRRLVIQSPIAMAVINEQSDIVLTNDAFVRLFGYGPETIQNTATWWSLAYPDPAYRASVMAEWRHRLDHISTSAQPFVPLEVTVRCKNGEDRTAEFMAQQIGDRRLVIALDLTLRKRAEEQVIRLNEMLEQRVHERTEELEIVNRELEGFSYSVSHDLRAPLRAISGFGNALNQDYRDRLDEEGQAYLDRILTASQRMGLLIDDLLRFSRLSRTDMLQEPIDMTELAEQAWQELQEINKEELGLAPVAELPPAVGDRSLVKQVLFNLLANAVKFSRGCQQRDIQVFAEWQDGQAVYVVRDNGVGFNMAYVDKLFGVFHRLHRAEEFEGTGVGLALCRRIIERHGGRIWAESQPDEGATFRFTLNSPNSAKV